MIVNVEGRAVGGGGSSSSSLAAPVVSSSSSSSFASSSSSSTQAQAQAQGTSQQKQGLVAGRSCRGCLFFSRTLQDSGKDPVCWGLSAHETLPASSFNQRNRRPPESSRPHSQLQQQQEQEQQQQQHQKQEHHQQQQQQHKEILQKQHKALMDFRYACVGYSLYPSTVPPSSSPSDSPPPTSTHSHSHEHPPPESSSSPSSQVSSLCSPIHAPAPALLQDEAQCQPPSAQTLPLRHPIPLLAWASATCASQVLTAAPSAPAVDPTSAGPLSTSSSDGHSSGPGSSHGSGSARSSGCPADAEGAAAGAGPEPSKEAGVSPPALPLCIGIEIFAATKAEQELQQAQGHEQQRKWQQEEEQGAAGRAEVVDGEQLVPEGNGGAQHGPGGADSGRRSSFPSRTPSPNGEGLTLEEFGRRYVRSARLVAKACAANFERLKGAVGSTIQDIFKGDK